MSDRCAIDKLETYNDVSVAVPIKEYGKFSEEAKALQKTFAAITSDSQSIYSEERKIVYKNAKALTILFESDWPGFSRENILEKYPLIKKRITARPNVSIIDVKGIIDNSPVITKDNLTKITFKKYEVPDDVNDVSESDNYIIVSREVEIVLDSYERYLSDSYYETSNMSKFCSLAPNIFSAIKEFSNFFDNISSISTQFDDLTSALSGANVKSMLQRLQNHIMNVVDSIMKNKLDILNSFSIDKLLNGKQFSSDAISKRVYGRINREKENISAIFSSENVEILKEKIKGLIAYAVSVFERKDIEEIEFLVYRFCNLIQRLEDDTDNLMYRLKNYSDSVDYARNTISASSNAATARAIQAGAIRFEPQVYETTRQIQTNRLLQESSDKGSNYTAPISAADIDGVTSWNEGKGDAKITFNGRWVSVLGRAGWEKVSVDVRVKLMRVQSRFGKRLTVNSGWRSPEYNASLRGSGKNSYHMRGEALDITWSGFANRNQEYNRFVQIAKEEGFTGFGLNYPSFIHIDVGPVRSW